ncbi:MAG: hypothetical protein ACTSUO_06915 [Candidatus Thorarchaeota archaeon]
MFVFKKEQQVIDFGGVQVGGNPGENPTVLIGGLFFKDQPIVMSAKKGEFDSTLAKSWVDDGVTMAEKTGHPLIIQVYGRTTQAIENHLSWLIEHYDGPFMFESTSVKARARAIEFCDETGVSHRAIYNSINLSTKSDELELIKNSSLNMAVVLGWSPRATSLIDRMDTVKKMVQIATDAGIEKFVVDPATMPVGAGYGLDYRTILAIKSELGLPTCLGPENAPSAWKFIRQNKLDDDTTFLSSIIAATTAAQVMATDCIMYGSMIWTKEVFAATALIGNAIATCTAESNRALGRERVLFEPPTYE